MNAQFVYAAVKMAQIQTNTDDRARWEVKAWDAFFQIKDDDQKTLAANYLSWLN